MHTFNYISCKLSRQVTCDSETETKQVEEKSADTALRESAVAATSKLKASSLSWNQAKEEQGVSDRNQETEKQSC